MAEEKTGEQQPNAADIEQRAKQMGWKPKEEFRGDEARWVDAETYVRRGEEFLPILQHSNKELKVTVDAQQQQLDELMRINRANAMALEELTKANKEQVVATQTRTIETITSEIAAAREAGDVQRELQLMDEREDAREALKAAKQKPAAAPGTNGSQSPDLTQTPEWREFLTQNSWFQEDAAMRGAAISIQQELLTRGRITASMPMAERLQIVAEETKKRFHYGENERRTGASRVEGGGGTGQGGGTASGKSYADLPPEAKTACDKAAKRLAFGEGRKYKDEAAWRKSYVETYFAT